jgi:hypothetical protein
MRRYRGRVIFGLGLLALVGLAVVGQFCLAAVYSPHGQIWIGPGGIEFSHGVNSGGWSTPVFPLREWNPTRLFELPFFGEVPNGKRIPVTELRLPWWMLLALWVTPSAIVSYVWRRRQSRRAFPVATPTQNPPMQRTATARVGDVE